MTAKENPFQPPTAAWESNDAALCLPFEGTITPEDYLLLCRIDRRERIAWYVLLGLVALVMVPILVMALVISVLQRELQGVALSGVMLAAALVGIFYMVRKLRSRATGVNKLSEYPDLLGPAHGELGAGGMLFFDGQRQYWFGPELMAQSDVSLSGVRVPVGADPYRYLALTSKLFSGFNVEVATRLLLHWRKTRNQESSARTEMWSRIGSPPDDSIALAYHGPASFYGSIDTSSWSNVVSQFVLAALAIYAWENYGYWLMVGLLVSWGFVIVSLTPWGRRFRAARGAGGLPHQAWMSRRELVSRCQFEGCRLPIRHLELGPSGEEVLICDDSYRTISIPKAALVDPADWDRLCSWAGAAS